MTRHEADVVAERKQVQADGPDEPSQILVQMLPSADRMAKEDVAHEGLTAAGAEIGDVSGAVQDLQLFLAETHGVAVLEPAGGFVGLGCEIIFRGGLFETADQMPVGAVRAFDARSGQRGAFSRTTRASSSA